MVSSEKSLLESIIHITEERDKKSLMKVLMETLSDFIDFETLCFIHVPKSSPTEYLEAVNSIPENSFKSRFTMLAYEYSDRRIKPEKELIDCISSNKILLLSENQVSRMLIPISLNGRVTDILEIYGHTHSSESSKLIKGFIRIYSNFLAIINDNEHDTLTGLLNRKTFENHLASLLSSESSENVSVNNKKNRMVEEKSCCWVAMLDIDFFKNINDSFGHIYGDEVLLLFSELMKNAFRDDDLLFRYGGEEFVVILSPATETEAFEVFERFRKKVELYSFPQVDSVTVSIGFVKIDLQCHPRTVLEHADKALYYAKEHGRNQTQSYNDLIQLGKLNESVLEDDIELF